MALTPRPSRHSLPDLFDKALAYAGHTHTRADVWEGIKAGRFQYWPGDKSCIVTEIIEFPRTRKLHIFLAAGDLDEILDVLLPQMKEFAREHGCSSITNISRKGFLKRLPAYGFVPKSVTFELELN